MIIRSGMATGQDERPLSHERLRTQIDDFLTPFTEGLELVALLPLPTHAAGGSFRALLVLTWDNDSGTEQSLELVGVLEMDAWREGPVHHRRWGGPPYRAQREIGQAERLTAFDMLLRRYDAVVRRFMTSRPATGFGDIRHLLRAAYPPPLNRPLDMIAPDLMEWLASDR